MEKINLCKYISLAGLIYFVIYFNYSFKFLPPNWEYFMFQFEFLVFLIFFTDVVRKYIKTRKK